MLIFPLTKSVFLDRLPIQQMTPFTLTEGTALSETGGGEVIRHRLAPRLWEGELTLGAALRHEIAEVEALIERLREPGASFFMHDLLSPEPRAEALGHSLTGTVQIAVLDANARLMALKGLPEGYPLTPGDWLGFSYGAAPVRYALHRIVTPVTANTLGQTALFEVMPALRPGAAVDATVILRRPVCKAVALSATPGAGRAVITDGGTLRWRQTLR